MLKRMVVRDKEYMQNAAFVENGKKKAFFIVAQYRLDRRQQRKHGPTKPNSGVRNFSWANTPTLFLRRKTDSYIKAFIHWWEYLNYLNIVFGLSDQILSQFYC